MRPLKTIVIRNEGEINITSCIDVIGIVCMSIVSSSCQALRANERPSLLCSRPSSQPSRPATSASMASFGSIRGADKQSKLYRKMRRDVMPAIKFEEAFDMAYQRAVKRLAAERKVVKGPISLNKNASKIYISGLLSPGRLAKRHEFLERSR